MTLGEKLLAVHDHLERAALPHAFGGAIALGFYVTEPRGTRDLDVNIFLEVDQAARTLEALPEGVEPDPDAERLIRRDGQHRLWWDVNPIDLFFKNLEVHERAAANVREVRWDGLPIPILGPVELAVFKAMFDRTKDWADIEEMLKAETLDVTATKELLGTMIDPGDVRFGKLANAIAIANTGQV